MEEIIDMLSLLWSGDVKFLPEDVIYEILLRLPVPSLLRFKSVCKSWRAIIDGSYFIKQHVHHHHHYNRQTSLKDRKLIFPIPSESCHIPHPNTFLLTSVPNFEVPTAMELDTPIFGYADYALQPASMATFDGIICMNYRDASNYNKECFPAKYIVSLFNPATKQARVLPKSSISPIAPPNSEEFTGVKMSVSVGFGFDVNTKDYKVVRLFLFNCKGYCEKRVEVYNLSSDSWRIIDAAVPVDIVKCCNTLRPFQDGTCYCWWGSDFILQKERFEPPKSLILCFDFGSEVFRTVDIPDVICGKGKVMKQLLQLAIINDSIACISCYGFSNLEIWVLNEYGSTNQSWAMHIKVVDFLQIENLWSTPSSLYFSMDGKYVFFYGSGDLSRFGDVCRYDLVTKAIKKHSLQHFFEIVENHSKLSYILRRYVVCLGAEFKESLVSVRRGDR